MCPKFLNGEVERGEDGGIAFFGLFEGDSAAGVGELAGVGQGVLYVSAFAHGVANRVE